MSAPAAWMKFLTTLESQGVTFDDVQFTDPKSREELISEITADFTKLERAVITSHWNKLNTQASQQQQQSSPAQSMNTNNNNTESLLGGASTSRGGITLNNQNQQQVGNQSQQQQQQLPLPGSKETQSVGNYLISGEGISYGQNSGPFDPTALRTALARGDATSALPSASEMLQKDPLALCSLLHEYAPHLSVATIKSILGLDGGPPGRGLPASVTASTSDQSPLRFGAFEGNDVASSKGSKNKDASGDSNVALINGQNVPVGQVLTNVGLSSIYGQGFSITCNGQLVHLPYCVQPGDRITVTAAESRI